MKLESVAVFGGGSFKVNSREYDDACTFGRLIGRLGLAIYSGGFGGIMEAVSRGGNFGQAERIVGITVPARPKGNQFLTAHEPVGDLTGRDTLEGTMLSRRAMLMAQTDAWVFFPGEIGTVIEFLDAVNVKKVAADLKINHEKPMILIGPGEYWVKLIGLVMSMCNGDFWRHFESPYPAADYLIKLREAAGH